ncbi:MAG TPA: MarR family transcriptional regulator [Gemmatimonadaceae bacterium]|nr:MarR family transcriptional regulator [Gemmatimonadaceae bacterium]
MTAVRRIVQALHQSARDVERALGISGAQLFVLEQLAREPAESVNALAARTVTHQSSVSVVVRRLVERGLVRRSRVREDRRRVRLEITPDGAAVLRRAPITAQARLVTGLRALPARSVQRLAATLEQWLGEARIPLPAPLFFETGEGGGSARASRRPPRTRRAASSRE